ncbi:hypothetical protein BpHYR1_010584 [Brachionus plicatilis]|uniref:Uncharacterized protein n=1 Tax=Brachionus plicatilis TaxID=10195 RepID=A0A3M7QK13_BRAPC|nr:hypothetical protein BpHYR1_010584 [Brachionus plicatilis]
MSLIILLELYDCYFIIFSLSLPRIENGLKKIGKREGEKFDLCKTFTKEKKIDLLDHKKIEIS